TGGAGALGAPAATAAGGPGAPKPDVSGAGASLGKRKNARDFLESQGITFPPGSSAYYLPSNSRLIVRNTQQALDLIDILVEAQADQVPKQVEIESKFVEITQNNLKELSFDTLL